MSVFTDTESSLLPLLEELRRLEPIFHAPEFGTSTEEYDRRMAPGYWEVGASGRRYSRQFILRHLNDRAPVLASLAGWKTEDHALRRLGPSTYLLTYLLRQGERLTRRSTIWESGLNGWQVLYHQGTIVSASEDDASPS